MTQRELHFRVTFLVVSMLAVAYGIGWIFNQAFIEHAGWLKDLATWAVSWSPLGEVLTAFTVYIICMLAALIVAWLIIKYIILPIHPEDKAAIRSWWRVFKKRHIVDVDPYDESYFARKTGRRDGEIPRLPHERGYHKQSKSGGPTHTGRG